MRQLPKLNRIVHKDFDLNMRINPATGKLIIKKSDDAVKQALKTLILTNHYERPFRPLFGGNVRRTLFENYSPGTNIVLKNDIDIAIKNYESRIAYKHTKDDSIQIIPDADNNGLTVNILFKVNNTLNENNVIISLVRVR